MSSPQDEFRQWFRVTVHVMLAPGKRPFDTVPPWAGDGLSNGDGGPGLSAEQEDRCGMFPQNQLVPVPPLVVFLFFFKPFISPGKSH